MVARALDDAARAELARGGEEFAGVGVGGDADQFEGFGVGAQDAEGVFPDRAGGAEQDNALSFGRRDGHG